MSVTFSSRAGKIFIKNFNKHKRNAVQVKIKKDKGTTSVEPQEWFRCRPSTGSENECRGYIAYVTAGGHGPWDLSGGTKYMCMCVKRLKV